MELTHRSYFFILIVIFLSMHALNIIIIEFHSAKINDILFRCVPNNVYIAVDILSFVSVGALFYGLLTFSQSVVLGWFIFLSIAWHFPFAMIIVNGIMVKYKRASTAHYFMGTLIPALQLSVWSLIMIHTFRYWCCLNDFIKLPDYLQSNPNLLELSHHRYETDKLRKQILATRQVVTYHYRSW